MAIRDLKMRAGARADLTAQDVELLDAVAEIAREFQGLLTENPKLEEAIIYAEEFLEATPDAATIGGDAGVQAKLEEMQNAVWEIRAEADQVARRLHEIGNAADWLLAAGAGR